MFILSLRVIFYLFLSCLVILVCGVKVDGQENKAFKKILVLEKTSLSPVRYPITGNSPFPIIKGVELEQVNDALKLAKKLTKDCQCDQALQDYGIKSLAELLKSEVNVDIFDGRTSTLGLPWMANNNVRETVGLHFSKNKSWLRAGVIQSAFTGKGNMIFLNDYFFNPTKFVTLALEQRSIILIHEAVHQYGGKDDNHFGGSQRLTNLINKACLPTLKIQ